MDRVLGGKHGTVSLVYEVNLMMPIVHVTKMILHFTKGFIQR